MKLTVLQENLSRSLYQVNRITTGKTTLPILNNVLIEAEKGLLKLSTTNLEIAITTQIRAKVEQEGKITIPCQIFNNFIDLIDKEQVEIELKGSDLELKSKNITTKIRGILADEFPIIPKIEKKNYCKIKTEFLKSALDKILFAVSPSEARTEISGVFFSFNSPESGFLTLVGTDSYRLAEKTIQIETSDLKEKSNLIVPAKTLQELSRLIENNGFVEISISDNQVLFSHESAELISRIINEEYPDYKQIIPTSFATNVLLEKKPFLKAIKTASLFARAGVNDINLKFDAQKDQVTISALNAQLGQSEIVLKAEIKGGDNEIVFNYRYLLDGLLNISGDEVKLSIINDSTPGVLTAPEDKNYLYLVMPIKK